MISILGALIDITAFIVLIAISLGLVYLFDYRKNKESGRIKTLYNRGLVSIIIFAILLIVYIILGGRVSDLYLMGLTNYL